MSFFAGWHAVVLGLYDLQMICKDDRLFYVLACRRLDLEPMDPTGSYAGQSTRPYLFG